jgi:PadR family transcriptional regulator PadR
MDMDLRHGTLDLFLLRGLAHGPLHGYGLIAWLRDASGGELDVEEGALYHALHRMERRGWLRADWGPSENRRQARYYRLTPLGRRELSNETKRWTRYAALAARILQPRKGRA